MYADQFVYLNTANGSGTRFQRLHDGTGPDLQTYSISAFAFIPAASGYHYHQPGSGVLCFTF